MKLAGIPRPRGLLRGEGPDLRGLFRLERGAASVGKSFAKDLARIDRAELALNRMWGLKDTPGKFEKKKSVPKRPKPVEAPVAKTAASFAKDLARIDRAELALNRMWGVKDVPGKVKRKQEPVSAPAPLPVLEGSSLPSPSPDLLKSAMRVPSDVIPRIERLIAEGMPETRAIEKIVGRVRLAKSVGKKMDLGPADTLREKQASLLYFTPLVHPTYRAMALMEKRAFIGALLGGIGRAVLGGVGRFGARYAPRLLGRTALRIGQRFAPQFTSKTLLPQMLERGAARAVARYGGQAERVMGAMLPKSMAGGRLAQVQNFEQMQNAARLLRGGGAQAQQRLLGRTLTPAVQRPASVLPTTGGQSPAQAIQAAQQAAAKGYVVPAGAKLAPTGPITEATPGFMDIAKGYLRPETWRAAWNAPGAKFNTALSMGLGLMTGQSPLEAGFGAAAALPFARAGTLPYMAASMGASALGSKLFGKSEAPQPVAEAPQPMLPPININMPGPAPMPMPMMPQPPMLQPGYRG